MPQELCSFCRKVRRLLQPQAYANLHWGPLFIRLEAEPHNSSVKESSHGCGNGMQQFIGRTLTTTTRALIRALINDRASLSHPLNIGVAFPYPHLQEDKGKVTKARKERKDKRNILEDVLIAFSLTEN